MITAVSHARLACAAAVFAAAAVTMHAQRFQSGALAVRVDVLVTDDKKPVTGLTTPDFELRDEGVVQDVKLLEIEQLPLNVVLALDTSSSLAGSRLASLLVAARALLSELRDADRIALMTFSNRVRLLVPLTPSRLQVISALDRVSAAGRTVLRDAVFAALSLPEAEGRRTLTLIFSDGVDTASWLTPAKVLETAKASDTVVYVIRVQRTVTVTAARDAVVKDTHGFLISPLEPPTTQTIDLDRRDAFVADLVDETGGRVLYTDRDEDLRATFSGVVDEFRNRYVLSYTPAGVSATGWHNLDVRLKNKKGKVTARRGYFAGPVASPR